MKEQNGIELEHLCSAVGAVTIIWSLIDRQLENWKMFIFDRYRDDPLCKKNVLSLEQRIIFFRHSFHKFNELFDLESRVNKLLNSVEKYADKRHAFVHGVFDSVSPEMFVVERVKFNDRIPYLKQDQFDLTTYQNLLEELIDLMSKMSIVSADLLKKLHKNI